MADFTTAARPYAKAVFEMAQSSGNFNDWSDRLTFWAAIIGHPDMISRLDAPGITQQDRATMVESVAADGLDDESRNLIRLLAENNRLNIMPDIVGIYEELRRDAEGEIEATVTSAFELNDAQRDKIAAALSKRLSRKVRIISEVDQDLIGGAIIRAGDLVIDGSLQGRLEKLSRAVAS